MSGRFIKVVIVGPAGVGKTSLRHQFISGRFATGYRATIGTDFITKTLPHYSSRVQRKPPTAPIDPGQSTLEPGGSSAATPIAESVTLQIWDTAGQERFSSLSTAFFRGADAVILVFDVNKPETLTDLARWWDEFRVKVPIPEGEEANFCVVVIGNKVDLVPGTRKGGKEVIGRQGATGFLNRMIPVEAKEGEEHSLLESFEDASIRLRSEPPSPVTEIPTARKSSLSISRPQQLAVPTTDSPPQDPILSTSHTPRPDHPFKTSPSQFGTMTSTRTGISVYHTPSSSFFASSIREPSRERTLSTASNKLPGLPEDQTTPRTEDFEMSMDLEYDYNYDLNGSAASMSGMSAYATAKSTPSHSPSPKRSGRSIGSMHIGSIASQSSLATVKPRPAVTFREQPMELLPDAVFTGSTSPSRSRSDSSTSTDSSVARHPHNLLTADLPTPSASPPSPPTLTASIMATLQQQQDDATSVTPESRPLDVGPKLFFTSAKYADVSTLLPYGDVTTTATNDVFSYVSERVVRRWEYEESLERDRQLQSISISDSQPKASGSIRLGQRLKDMVGITTVGRACCA